ncbi:OmpP1/FadL family transporter [Chitinophaga nivalis]|uniref:Outer membrane protein transport protein n=1 Tax=Chitinophaga nivalis TaxID=2991709 RepID=A0ABT3IQQ9_9BACT|nr:outer membrane protein transport protein [Chitinophaga nivalis]MCW3464027.1 outer membrane protein transport protein [Chitinophaga nivalis]MCW3486283.1 outer membrane protein transport protein [Chitinophaga nivalis]
MAQSSSDALLYSNFQPFGTARTQALGGGGVGLGGDYTSAHLNPAGIGVFKTGEFLFSAGVGITGNNSTYQGNNILDNKGNRTNFQLPNIGVIFAANRNSGSSSWNNVTFSLGMNRLANYNNKVAIAGFNDVSSYSDSWVDDLVGQNTDVYKKGYPLGASLAYQSGLIDQFKNAAGNIEPLSNASPTRQEGGPIALQQRGILETQGGLNEFAFAVAGNYGDRFYIGASVVVPSINYKETLTFMEDDASGKPNNGFAFFDYNKYLKRTGLGIGGKLGVLFKATDRLRLGAAFHTPVFYSMHDSYSANMTSNTENINSTLSAYSEDLTNGYPVENDYNYTAPLRLMGGASFFIGDLSDPSKPQGFISADYEYVNQSSGKFRMSNDRSFENDLNTNIGALYKAASNVKVGAELKFLSIYAVRAGFAAYGNPYSNDSYNAGIDASRKVYSGGLGFRTKGIYGDLTYSYAQGKDRWLPYRVADAGYTPKAATIDYNRSNIVMTIGLKF